MFVTRTNVPNLRPNISISSHGPTCPIPRLARRVLNGPAFANSQQDIIGYAILKQRNAKAPMFERNRTENPSNKREKAISVELTMDDGCVLKGRFFVAASRQAYDELNGNAVFLDFQPYEGARELISKAAIRSVRLTNIPKNNHLKVANGSDEFDPHDILCVPHGAEWETVREAYHRLSKLYHPDRYANLDLPEEVANYLDTMSRRVNAAFSALEKPHQVKREFARAKSEPIYQRG